MNYAGFHSPRHERGIATLFIILMVGLAVSVSVVATVYSVRSAQTQQLTSHTATTARAAAWRGVEALRQYLVQVDKSVWPTWVSDTPQKVTGLDPLGVAAASVTFVHQIATDHYQVGANVTGQSGLGSALTTSTVQVVYDIAPGAGSTIPVCHSMQPTPMLFNGNVTYSGGKFDGDQSNTPTPSLNDFVVNGNLNISGGTSARIAGCVKGDATITGGGVTDNTTISAEGKIDISGMGFPKNSSLWAKNIYFTGGGSGGPFAAIEAGAYQANVYDTSNAAKPIGTTAVGGVLLASSVASSSTIPWTSGTILPSQAGDIVITLATGETFLVDLSSLKTNTSTGVTTGFAGAVQLSGATHPSLPDSVLLKATGIYGGNISTTSGASITDATLLWGNTVSILNWGMKYGTLKANGNLSVLNGTISTALTGGGNLTSNNGSTFPSMAAGITGNLAGNVYNQSGGIVPPSSALPNVSRTATGTTPGLPGVPWCDARVNTIDVNNFKTSANYVFGFASDGVTPQLTVQNLSSSGGTVIASQAYPLTDPALNSILTCAMGTGAKCVKYGSYTYSRPTKDNKSESVTIEAWQLTQLRSAPTGIIWFNGPAVVTEDSPLTSLNAGIFATGDIFLMQGGKTTVTAPNLAPVSAVCGGATYPSNLCASSTELLKWKDEAGIEHVGMPIGNTAVATNGGLTANGWTIQGNVVLGGLFNSGAGGAVVNILGSLTVGSNAGPTSPVADTTISGGGLHVTTPAAGDASQLPTCSGIAPTSGTLGATVMWSRYL